MMTIAGLFRRYRRWNPVHPTYGAFWGLGIGLGCGVGWGPGFGPEAIGFVGAGCGAGFSVGVTFLGFGVGLPASGLTCLPYNAVACVSCEAFEFARSAVPVVASMAKEGWSSLYFHASTVERKLSEQVLNLNQIKWEKVAADAGTALKQRWRASGHSISDSQQKPF
eukprot:c21767_g1_i1 orf=545-1042(+)